MRQVIGYILVLVLSALITGSIAVYAWRQRRLHAAVPFALMMTGVTVWLLGYALELGSAELSAMLLWIKVSYLGVTTVPTLWLVFTLSYTGRDRWLTRRNLAGFFVVPLLLLALMWTNEWHHLYYTTYHVDVSGPFPMFAMTRGFTYWIGVVYAYVALLISTILLVRSFLRSTGAYRGQISTVLVGSTFPWVANVFYITGLNPFPYLNLTPLSFALTGLVIAWGLFRYRLLDVVPVARDKVVEGMRDGVIVLDDQTRIVDMNPIAQEIMGLPLSGAIGKPADSILPEPLGVLADYLATPERQTQIVLGDAPALRYYDLRVSPLYDRREKLNGWVAVLHDMTERKQAELSLQERTQELEARNAELDAFAHTVAHDLKSPLSVMVGFSSLLYSQIDKISRDDLLYNLHRIARSGDKMANIIDELLLLARIREIEQVDPVPLAMGEIIPDVLERLRTVIDDTEATVTMPEAWPTALGYAPWVEEIWANYISNAAKYGGRPDEGVLPQVVLGALIDGEVPATPGPCVPTTSTHITFWVRDNGPGLTEAEAAQLFTPFTRLHEVRAEGHGLGLSIVRRIIDHLQGEVGVVSELGVGSIFYFTLPLS